MMQATVVPDPATGASLARRIARGPWLYWVVSRAGIVVLLATVRSYRGVLIQNDVRNVYYPDAHALAHGVVPYVGFHYEYPPGTLPFVWLGWLLGGHRPAPYTAVWVLLMLVLDAVVLWSVLRLADRRTRCVAAGTWLLGGMVMFWSLLHNDLIVVAPVALALALTARRPALAGASWAFGAVAKLWPAPPLLAIALARTAGRARLVAGAAVMTAATLIAVAVPGATHAMVRYLVAYQGHRPVEMESSWADVLWLHAAFDGARLRPVLSFGSPNLLGGHSALFASLAYHLTTAASVLIVLAAVGIRWRLGREIPVRVWVWLVAAFVLGCLLIGPVFSAQYGIWAIGAGATVAAVDRGRTALAVVTLCLLTGALTTAEFPFGFFALAHGEHWAVAVLTARTVVVAGAFVCAVLGTRAAVRDARATDVADGPATSRARPGGAAAGSRRR